jgi:hypothetical protein
LIRASAEIGLLPATLGKLDSITWIPVDTMAKIVVELNSTISVSGKPLIFHAVNLNHVSWSLLVHVIRRHIPGARLISLQEWVTAHKKVVDASEDPTVVAGAKLLYFFQGLDGTGPGLDLETVAAVDSSATLKQLGAVSEDWMDLWMRQWQHGLGAENIQR